MLCFTIFRWPSEGFKLPDFKNPIKRAYLLQDPERTNIPVTLAGMTRVVQTPHYAPNVMATTLVVEIDGGRVEK